MAGEVCRLGADRAETTNLGRPGSQYQGIVQAGVVCADQVEIAFVVGQQAAVCNFFVAKTERIEPTAAQPSCLQLRRAFIQLWRLSTFALRNRIVLAASNLFSCFFLVTHKIFC